MEQRFLISVIVPTCNRNDLLSKCLQCLQTPNQTFNDAFYEVIVSDDSEAGAAKSFIEANYPWVKWVDGPKKGPAANRNYGASFAKGQWLVFIDDDCMPDKNFLEEYYKAINNDTDCPVFEGCIYSSEKVKSPLFITPINDKGGHLWSCNFLIKKDVFETVKGFDENFKYPNLEDNDLNDRLKAGGYKIIFVKDAKVNHPPRQMAAPKKLAKYHESWFYYHKKSGQKSKVLELLLLIIKTRLFYIRKNPLTWDSVLALKNLILELFYTLFQYGIK